MHLRVYIALPGISRRISAIETLLERGCEDFVNRQDYTTDDPIELPRQAREAAYRYLRPRGWGHASVNVALVDAMKLAL